MIQTLEDLKKIKKTYLEKLAGYKYQALICGGTGCISAGCAAVERELKRVLEEKGFTEQVTIIKRGCMGTCAVGPVLFVLPDETYYTEVTPEKVEKIVEQHFINGKVVEEYTFYDAVQGRRISKLHDAAFFRDQVRIALRNCGLIDVTTVDAYIAKDGYMAAAKYLSSGNRQGIIDELIKAGLRGRGGGGFPTGVKWLAGAKAPGKQKYIICNADEGDPGAFMDRSIFEGDPHSVIEGMLLGGYAIGAEQGYVYIRAEYPVALERLQAAITEARARGLLGKNIFGSGFNFDIEIRIGAGAFVCGEETALMASVEGKRGEPRQKPPFPFQRGLFGKPTIINNVETLANVPAILANGADWFRQYGTSDSPGTKVFALTGNVVNTGLVEIPMGMALGHVIFDIGGGIPNEKKFKAAQTGGPSGGCITTEKLNTPMDYDSLVSLGSMMGSGGLIVMDEDTCMVDTARFYMEFIVEESCGKCAACRIGTRRMLDILERITEGKGKPGDIELLQELGETIKQTAMCGLGQTAPNPVLSTIKYFREEYEEHINQKFCRAGVCSALFISPCENTCPAGINVPGYISLITAGRFIDAYKLIHRENPFPAVCGRICTRPCESKCRRGTVDEAVSIRNLKRFVADYTYKREKTPVSVTISPRNGKKVAIIGAGPSGLTCGYYLARLGYDVDVYEAHSVAGGVLAFGIPSYRLPKDVLAHEISLIEQVGVNIKLNTEVGKDIQFEELKNNYDAIYISIGTQFPQKVNIPGEDLAGVFHGINFLKMTNLGQLTSLSGTVAVIGGGNTAIDSARTARRLGADKVIILYRRNREAMPADKEEICEALEEGIELMEMVAPVRFIPGKDGKVSSVECVKMEFGSFDDSGRRKTHPIPGSNFTIDVAAVIPAVSQYADFPFVSSDEIGVTPWGTFAADSVTKMTQMEGVFAGGDIVRGPDTIINAIADGKQAAASIDKYLGGKGELNKGEEVDVPSIVDEDEISVHERFPIDTLDPETRKSCFAEVSLGFHKLNAIAESMRCLHCDRR
ncbi:MAG TPA: FAD-dependent oxidoreductase [Clostridia bacterium]|nr:FAD-dependent oxidoreductase [Clostridia bacterium]